MRRFYKEAVAHEADGGFTILLDDKPIATPGKALLIVPSRALAEAIAGEWRVQGAEIRPLALPLTRLASAAIDIVAPRHGEKAAAVARYAATDLVCYRATTPYELRQRQHRAWQALIDWVESRYDAKLAVTQGVMPLAQPPTSLAILATTVASYDAMALAALELATTACGSLVLALALFESRIDAETAFTLSQIDESFEIEQWGEDEEASRRRALLREDILLAARFHALLNAP